MGPTIKEAKSLGIGLGLDGASIGCMVMQVLHPGTAWDYLGNAGYAFQIFSVWMGLIIVPMMLACAWALGNPDFPEDKREALEKALMPHWNNSVFYMRWVLCKELAICLLFSSMGWGWLAFGTLLTTFLIHCLWHSGTAEPVEA